MPHKLNYIAPIQIWLEMSEHKSEDADELAKDTSFHTTKKQLFSKNMLKLSYEYKHK